jgi:hypothetical protein
MTNRGRKEPGGAEFRLGAQVVQLDVAQYGCLDSRKREEKMRIESGNR